MTQIFKLIIIGALFWATQAQALLCGRTPLNNLTARPVFGAGYFTKVNK